jgi:hypothetical protein
MAVFQGKRPFPWAQGLCPRAHAATHPTQQSITNIHQNYPILISLPVFSASPRLRGEYSFAIGGRL